MFIELARALKKVQSSSVSEDEVSYDLFSLPPVQLEMAREVLWEWARRRAQPVAVQINDAGIGGHKALPPEQSELTLEGTSLRDELLRVLYAPGAFGGLGGELLVKAVREMLKIDDAQTPPPWLWNHLIYAYAIENTRAIDIFSKVLFEIVHGERLGAISAEGHRWARATEELFFRNQSFSFISSIQSSIRPDPGATRRNAYYRMFAMDLNHGAKDNSPYPYERGDANNKEFVATLEMLLSEIWRGYMNATNNSGPNTTDNAIIADLALQLQEMLNERRINGNLTREEFIAVSTASWFHLTLESPNAPIIVDLKADATTTEERLRRVAERVGLASHSKSRSLFALAKPLSNLLSQIELGTYSDSLQVRPLYDPNLTPNATQDTLSIINHWASATGKNLKATPVMPAR
jgi:hypothetical protein